MDCWKASKPSVVMSKVNILIVDEDLPALRIPSSVLSQEGYEVHVARRPSDAIDHLGANPADLILFDLKTSKRRGVEISKVLKKAHSQIPFIVMTTPDAIGPAVEMIKKGAYGYLVKPLNYDELRLSVKKALEKHELRREVTELRSQLYDRLCFRNLVGKSKKMKEVFNLISMVAGSDSTVLVQGETGTGKEIVAKAIHFSSHRKEGPFVPVNCAAFPETLLESELFGHEKGAYTGAIARKKGTFELANGGTLLLDEIDVASPGTQVELLRVLEEREFRRVGGTETVRVDVRVIASTNGSLEKLVTDGTFRRDLFYRLNVIPITIPPLRDRLEDLPYIIEHLLHRFSVQHKKKAKRFSAEALGILYNCSWPGNVRELENLIDRLMVTCTDEVIIPRNLPTEIHLAAEKIDPPNKPPTTDLSLKEMEAKLIKEALEKTRGSRVRSAELLGISRKALWSKMKNHRIT